MPQATLRRLALGALTSLALASITSGSFADGTAGNGTIGGGDSPQPTQTINTHSVRRHFNGNNDCLRAVAAGIITRNDGSPTAFGTITLPPGPTAANIVWAGLYWDTYHNGSYINAVSLNGVAVAPVAIGTTASPCWSELYTTAFYADVTGIAAAGGNLVTGMDDSGILGSAPESPGASLVVVYRSPGSTACEIIVMDGNDMVAGGSASNVVPVTCGPGIPATLWFIGGDGQVAGDNQMWNGAAVGDGDDFESSDPVEPGAATTAGWDTDPRAVVTGPPSVATVDGFGDCINWVVTVIEVGVHPSDNCQPTPTRKSSWGELKMHYR